MLNANARAAAESHERFVMGLHNDVVCAAERVASARDWLDRHSSNPVAVQRLRNLESELASCHARLASAGGLRQPHQTAVIAASARVGAPAGTYDGGIPEFLRKPIDYSVFLQPKTRGR